MSDIVLWLLVVFNTVMVFRLFRKCRGQAQMNMHLLARIQRLENPSRVLKNGELVPWKP